MSDLGTAPAAEPCGLARLPLLLLHRTDELGLDRADLMRRAGFHDDDLRDPDARVPIRKMWALWQLAVDATQDEDLALRVFGSTPLRSVGLVGYVMRNSSTLGDAFERLARHGRLVTEAIRMHWERDATGGRITLGDVTPGEPRRAADGRLAFLVTAARELTGKPLAPRVVALPYPRPGDVTCLEATFGSNVLFDRSQAEIAFDGPDVDSAVIGADTTLGGYLDDLADRLLEAMPAAEFQDRVRRAIWAALREGRADLESVAARLAVSPRTLQRRLQAEGSSYAALLDTVRRELAIGLLRGRTLAVYEVAFLLGYSEPSTFHRAFRRWTGTSPRAFRKTAS